jgi:hypothetical protein
MIPFPIQEIFMTEQSQDDRAARIVVVEDEHRLGSRQKAADLWPEDINQTEAAQPQSTD